MSDFPANEPDLPPVPTSIFRESESADPAPPARPRRGSHQPRHARLAPRDESVWPTIGWTALGALIPGVGLWRAGHRVAGPIITGVFVLLIGGIAAVYFGAQSQLRVFLTDEESLIGLTIGLLVLGLAWVVVIGVSHLALRDPYPSTGHRIAGAVAVGLLSLAVITPAAFGADMSYNASMIAGIFADEEPEPEPDTTATTPSADPSPSLPPPVDPWADRPRLNILILGGDSGQNRDPALGDRTDTVIVASVNTKTGATTLFSLPRQTLRMPFPKDSKLYRYFPNGFIGSGKVDEWFLSSMPRNLPSLVSKDILGKNTNTAYGSMKLSVGEALGLKIDYYILINMDGFRDFINAIGGITVNINQRIPIGGVSDRNILPRAWIEPGPNQHLTGYYALYYARGRFGLDDPNRMARQRCVINAVAQQANPQNLLANYSQVAKAAKNAILTDVPQSQLSPLVTLAERIKGTTLRNILFEHNVDGFSTTHPNWAQVRTRVQKALAEADAANQPSASPSVSASPSGSASPSASASGSAKPSASATPKKEQSVDISDACAYHPVAKDPNAGKGTSKK